MQIAILMGLESPWSREIALRLASLGHGVHVIEFARPQSWNVYLRPKDPFQADQIAKVCAAAASVHRLGTRFVSGIRYFLCAPQLRRICSQCKADVLLSLYGGGFATMAYLSRFRPYAVYVMGSDVFAASRLSRLLSPRALRAAAIVLANGGYLAEQARRFAPGADVTPLVVGVDTEQFLPRPTDNGRVKIICTRGFLPVYNNEAVIRGLAVMPNRKPDVKVTFTSPGECLDRARALAERLLPAPVRDCVSFLGGVTQAEMLRNLQASQVYVSLSRSDGTSISLLEALACGLFPVLSDIPQNREWIDPALENGILVPLDQPQALAEALARAAGDPGLRARAAEVNRRLILSRADGRKSAAVLAAHLADIVRNVNH